MAVRKAGTKAGSKGYKDSVKAIKPRVSATKSPIKPKTVASKSAINQGAMKPAAISGGAKFGGAHKRSGNRLHRIGQAEYRNRPFFKTPKLLTAPKITLEQAYRNTTLPEIRTSKFVELISIQPGKVTFKKGPLKGFKVYRARTYTTINRHRHEVLMMYEPDENGFLRTDSRFIFSCSCPFLKFTLEYSNAKLGLSFIYYSNGQPPVITNPRLRFSLCLAEDSLVSTTAGLVPIKDINVGDYVNTLYGPKLITQKMATGLKPVVRIRMSSGTHLDATREHRVLVLGADGNLIEKKVNDLVAGDWMIERIGGNGGRQGLSRLQGNPGFVRQLFLDAYGDEQLKIVQVYSLKPLVRRARTYDIAVDDVEHFFANGLLVHNCKHAIVACRHLLKKARAARKTAPAPAKKQNPPRKVVRK